MTWIYDPKETRATSRPTCPCGCADDMHIGEIGCPCALPGEPPCATPLAADPEAGWVE